MFAPKRLFNKAHCMKRYRISVWAPVLALGGFLNAFARPGVLIQLQEAQTGAIATFGTITLAPAFVLDGTGKDVDSIAFWEAPDPTNTLLLVTAKGNNLLEVWQCPFQGHELVPIRFANNVNGIAVDQATDLVYVSDRKVTVLSLPDLQTVDEFGQGIIGAGENNLSILHHTGGRTLICVSEDHKVHRFVAETWEHLGFFEPAVSSIETLQADDYYQMIVVPEEQGPAGRPGVHAYYPDGAPFLRNGTNRFGNHGEFNSDEEGILLYTFPTGGKSDNGAGFYVVSDQRSSQTDFEFFDRQTWSHLGTLRIEGVSNTDGIASTQSAIPGYPLGLFAAIDDDTTAVGLGWDVILRAMGMTPYRLWALDSGLDCGVNDGFADDPDGDKWPNLKEFALDGDPLSGANDDKQRVLIEQMDGTNYITYTFPVRDRAAFVGNEELSAAVDGIGYSIAGSFDILSFDQPMLELVPASEFGLPALNPGWAYRTFRLDQPISSRTSGFLRLRVLHTDPPLPSTPTNYPAP